MQKLDLAVHDWTLEDIDNFCEEFGLELELEPMPHIRLFEIKEARQ